MPLACRWKRLWDSTVGVRSLVCLSKLTFLPFVNVCTYVCRGTTFYLFVWGAHGWCARILTHLLGWSVCKVLLVCAFACGCARDWPIAHLPDCPDCQLSRLWEQPMLSPIVNVSYCLPNRPNLAIWIWTQLIIPTLCEYTCLQYGNGFTIIFCGLILGLGCEQAWLSSCQ